MAKESTGHSELIERILAAAKEVHSVLGKNLEPDLYQRALAIEFATDSINFIQDYGLPIYYHGECVGNQPVDFLVEGYVIVRIKVTRKIAEIDLIHTANFMRAGNIPSGVLLNFGGIVLESEELSNSSIVAAIYPGQDN